MADGQIIIEVDADASSYRAAVSRLGSAADSAARRATSAFSSLGEQISSIGSALTLGVTAPMAAAGGIAAKFAFEAVSAAEQADIAFSTMLGPEKAKKMLADLADFARTTPFELSGLTTATQRLLAYGFAAEDVIPLLTAVGDATAGLGAGQQGIDAVTRALGQMQAKGKVMSEEMLQLTEVGIPAWEYLAKAVSNGDIPKAMEMVTAGAVDAKTAIGALQDGMNADFGGMMAKQSKTLSGIISNMADAAYSAVTTIKDTEQYGRLTDAMLRLSEAIEPVASALMPAFADAIGYAAGLVDGAAGALESFAGMSQGGVDGVVALVGALAALGPALVVVGKAVQIGSAVGGAIASAASAVAGFSGKISDIAKEASGLASKMGVAGREAGSIFVRSIQGAMSGTGIADSAKKIADDMTLAMISVRRDIAGCFDGAKDAVASKFSGIGQAISSRFSGIESKLTPIVRILGESGKNAFDAFAGKFDFGSIATKGKAALSGLGGIAGKLAGGIAGAAAAVGGAAVGLAGMGLAAVAAGADLNDLAANVTSTVSGLTAGISVIAEQAPTVLPQMASQVAAAMPQLLDAFVQLFASIASVVPQVAPQLLSMVGQLMSAIGGMLLQYGPQMISFGVGLFSQLASSAAQAAPQIASALPGLISTIGQVIVSNLPTILSAGLELFMAIALAVVNAAPDIISALIAMLPSLASTIVGFAPQILSAAGTLIGAIASAIPKAASSILSALGSMLSQLPGAVADFAGQMASAGLDLVRGVANGIGSGASWVISKIQEVCGGALDAVKSFFGIHSPSRVMATMGRYLMEGMAGGIGDKAKAAASSMADAMKRIRKEADEGKPDPLFPFDFDVPMPSGARGALGFSGSFSSSRSSERTQPGASTSGSDGAVAKKLDELGRKLENGMEKLGQAVREPVDIRYNRREFGRLVREAE